jgi:hypothetical protein
MFSYNIWRAPNLPGSFSSTGPVSNFVYNPPSRTFNEYFSERVDHQVNSKLRLYGSWSYYHGNGLERPTSIQVNVFDGTTGYNGPSTSQNYSAGATYIISSTDLNEIRIGFFRPRNDLFVPSANQNWGATLGIPKYQSCANAFFQPERAWPGHVHSGSRLRAIIRADGAGRHARDPAGHVVAR